MKNSPLLVGFRRQWLVVLVAAVVYALFLGLMVGQTDAGFPLDDSWIHQTYARNLARSGQWEFVPGIASAGSTAPLWTALLAVGYLLSLPYLLWTYLLGFLCLVGVAWAGMTLWNRLWPKRAEQELLAGVTLVFTWPLVWAAGSGMETLLFILLGLLISLLYLRERKRQSIWMGLLAGLLVLTRPEGLLLVGLVLGGLLLRRGWSDLARFLVGASLLIVPYFLFNLSLSGQLWPNTLYAKQTEYAFLLERPLPGRFLSLLYFSLGGPAAGWQGMTGAHLLLVPGVLVAGWHAVRQDWTAKRVAATLPLLWAGGHIFAYAWRLPVTYQHGRYLWAALPIWILYGLAGWNRLFLYLPQRRQRLLRQTAALTFAVVLLLFLFLGAQAYATDVAFVEEEMVTVSHWLRQNTPAEAVVASHDIGALGYFAERPLLDLAGLISPDVIPFLADEEQMTQYVLDSEAEYLVTAPGWPYPMLTHTAGIRQLFITGYSWTTAQGLNNMAVYHLP